MIGCDGRLRCSRRFEVLRVSDGGRVLDAEIDYFLNLDTGSPCRFPVSPPVLSGHTGGGRGVRDFAVRGAACGTPQRRRLVRARTVGRWIGLGFIFLWFALGGLAHFKYTATEMKIMPPYLPWPHALVIISGVFEWLGAAGLLLKQTRRYAGWGLFALTIAVTPANV